MEKTVTTAFAAAVLGAAAALGAYEITPAVQKELTRQAEIVKGWAASPVVVKAVLEQNARGPLPGMDNEAWTAVRRSDDVIKKLTSSEAGRFLSKKVEDSDGLYVRAFLSGSRGEKAAFTEKTISYLHKGSPKFDAPFASGRTWQGSPELDVLTETLDIQISAPVLSDGKSVGVLTVGISLQKLEKAATK